MTDSEILELLSAMPTERRLRILEQLPEYLAQRDELERSVSIDAAHAELESSQLAMADAESRATAAEAELAAWEKAIEHFNEWLHRKPEHHRAYEMLQFELRHVRHASPAQKDPPEARAEEAGATEPAASEPSHGSGGAERVTHDMAFAAIGSLALGGGNRSRCLTVLSDYTKQQEKSEREVARL
ncbi:MAG TPA: hypothetical protein VL494_13355, partial [Steroidobacteraceae bacterium]|nr:hypothetical protein [Steroidobacteraceae bacterium]